MRVNTSCWSLKLQSAASVLGTAAQWTKPTTERSEEEKTTGIKLQKVLDKFPKLLPLCAVGNVQRPRVRASPSPSRRDTCQFQQTQRDPLTCQLDAMPERSKSLSRLYVYLATQGRLNTSEKACHTSGTPSQYEYLHVPAAKRVVSV